MMREGAWAMERRLLITGLGIMWVADSLLQTQPLLFTAQFVRQVLRPFLIDQPGLWRGSLAHLLHLAQVHSAITNLLVIAIQLSLGLLLLYRAGASRWVHRTLWASLAWSASIWLVGEGGPIGQVTQGASFLTGAPGSALLYAVLSAALLWSEDSANNGRIVGVLSRLAGMFWLVGAVIQSAPRFWSTPTMGEAFRSVIFVGGPSWLARLQMALADSLSAHPAIWNAVFVLLMAEVGWFLLRGQRTPVQRALELGWLAFIWIFGMGFGVVGGLGTDPNTPPLWVLLMFGAQLAGLASHRSFADQAVWSWFDGLSRRLHQSAKNFRGLL